MKISAILLGAGESKRMGRDKLLLPWGKRTILEHCLQVLLRTKVNEVIVVLGHRKEEMAHRLIGKRVKVLFNPNPEKGMSSSIQRGLRALDPQSAGILIGLGDMPSLKSRTIDAILRAFREEKGNIILPSFRGRQGHPVLFHRKYKGELLKLKGDTGGKSIIMKHPEDVFVVPIKSEGVIRDIDTWVEYKKELRVKG
ncbi:MAG: molybdenum cofactor cytidylyltransferase [Deltaproteobacteria bacterium]|nr:molybdenum cofactor cytidylyltransferase [Deltaproteobacteria bacterium]MBM4323088.1 molybdenum cofactor cytidylyltransferase [Deltaproteobacteria bacterium]MBM4347449.1 molybdenum cofactor cytidylyltransferase [Deltaproteobacteria bacterium]